MALLFLFFPFSSKRRIPPEGLFTGTEIVSEYDQEIPQSQTADKPMAPLGRATTRTYLQLNRCNYNTERGRNIKFKNKLFRAKMNTPLFDEHLLSICFDNVNIILKVINWRWFFGFD